MAENWITGASIGSAREGSTDALLTPSQLVERYQHRITLRTLANWRTRGEGPRFVKVGARVFYTPDAIVEWENRRTIGKVP